MRRWAQIRKIKFKLKEILVQRNMTIKELSERTQLSEETLAELIRDDVEYVDSIVLARIGDALNIIDMSEIVEIVKID
jgi:DNA-binding Xre family transcriptional regulator